MSQKLLGFSPGLHSFSSRFAPGDQIHLAFLEIASVSRRVRLRARAPVAAEEYHLFVIFTDECRLPEW